MTEQKLANITGWLMDNIWRNGYVMHEPIIRGFNDDGTENKFQPFDLVAVISSLHNELYKEVTGEYYDYSFHWANKCGSDTDDTMFNEADDYSKIYNPYEDDEEE